MSDNKDKNPKEEPKNQEESNDQNPEKKELNSTFEKLPEDKKNLFSSILGWIVVLGLLGTSIYFVWNKWGEKLTTKEIFTQYKPLAIDSLENQNDTLNQDGIWVSDSLDLNSTDSIQLDDSTNITLDEEEMDSTNEVIDATSIKDDGEENPTKMDIFKVNTSYEKLTDSSIVATTNDEVAEVNEKLISNGLFEELLLPANSNPDVEKSFNQYAQAKIISSKSVLKLLSIVGKDILLGKNTDDDQSILDILVESEKVEGILIADRKGKIVYATNKKLMNDWVKNVMPKVEIQSNQLSWYDTDNQRITTLPLFHTYGRIGSAILITSK